MKTLYSLLVVPLLTFSFLVSNDFASTESSSATTNVKETKVNSFAFFRTHKHGRNGIAADWGMSSNNGVSGFLVEKTYEDPYDPYAEWAPVCSQPCNSSSTYRTIDNNCSPGFITYRVTAFLQPSGTIVSEYLTEHIVAH